MAIEASLAESALEYVFGDGDTDTDTDPGLIVTQGAADPDVDAWLEALAGQVTEMKRAVGADVADSVALGRIAALREEIARWRAGRWAQVAANDDDARAEATARPTNVVSMAEARVRRGWASPVNVITGVIVLAATIVFAVMFFDRAAPDEGPRITVAQAERWASEVGEEGLGFAGAELAPEDRGFLVGITRDLLRGEDGVVAPDAREAARQIAARAASGLEVEADADAVVRRVVEGCAALLTEGAEIAACEAGVAKYVAHRDAALAADKAP